jgi:hypothetical protein
MPDPNCNIRGCIHMPGFVIVCGYDEPLALASVGEGWAPLVREAFAIVEGRGRIVQVKEKFASLTIYADALPRVSAARSRAMHDGLSALRSRSEKVCEICGADGQMMATPGGWWHTACPAHARPGSAAFSDEDDEA